MCHILRTMKLSPDSSPGAGGGYAEGVWENTKLVELVSGYAGAAFSFPFKFFFAARKVVVRSYHGLGCRRQCLKIVLHRGTRQKGRIW